jgi:hypothetical protein
LNSNITNPTIEDIFSFTKTDDLNKAKEIIISSLKRDNLYLVYEEIEKPHHIAPSCCIVFISFLYANFLIILAHHT